MDFGRVNVSLSPQPGATEAGGWVFSLNALNLLRYVQYRVAAATLMFGNLMSGN